MPVTSISSLCSTSVTLSLLGFLLAGLTSSLVRYLLLLYSLLIVRTWINGDTSIPPLLSTLPSPTPSVRVHWSCSSVNSLTSTLTRNRSVLDLLDILLIIGIFFYNAWIVIHSMTDCHISQCGKELHHQHSEEQEGVQGGTHSWRNKDLAVRLYDSQDLPHWLPWCRASWDPVWDRDCSPWCRPCWELEGLHHLLIPIVFL